MKARKQLISYGLVSLFLILGAIPAIHQYWTLNSLKSVEALIDSSKIIEYPDGLDRLDAEYEPHVVYFYRVKGRKYISNRIFRRHIRGDYEWAREIRLAYRKGNSVTAYYDPASPSVAYLIKRYRFFPFLWVFLFMAGITVAAMRKVYKPGMSRQRKPGAPVSEPDGIFRPIALRTLDENWALYRFLRYLWLIPGGLVFYFYFSTSSPYETAAYWFAGINAFVLILFFSVSVYYSRLRRHLTEPSFTTSSGEFRLGGKIKIDICQGFNRPFQLKKIEVGLSCEQMTSIALRFKEGRPRKMLHNKWQTLANSRPVDIGDLLHFKVEFDIPEGLPATPKSVSPDNPGHRWCLHYKLYFQRELVLDNTYPIAVREQENK